MTEITQDDVEKIIELPQPEFLRLLNRFKNEVHNAKCPLCAGIEFAASKAAQPDGSYYGVVSSPWRKPLSQIWHMYLLSCIKCGFTVHMNYEPLLKWMKENEHG